MAWRVEEIHHHKHFGASLARMSVRALGAKKSNARTSARIFVVL